MQIIRIALAQKDCTPFAVQKNLQTALGSIALAMEQKADMIVFPEMFMTGYLLGKKAAESALAPDSIYIVTLQHAARQSNIAVVMGFPEKGEDGQVYNSMMFIDRDGSIAYVYRKTHLFGETDRAQFAPGQEIKAFDTSFGRIGMQICYDIEFPETSRLLALDGAQLICAASANMYPYEKLHTMFAKVRAIENHTPFAYVNAIGNDGTYTYCGQSCLIDADGQSIAKAEEQDILLIGEVAIGAVLEDKNMDYLQNRRQDIY